MSIVDGMLNQTVTSIISVTADKYGDKTEAVKYSSVPCRWQEKEGRTFDALKNIKEYSIEAWFHPSYVLSYTDIVTKDGNNYYIVAIKKRYDIDGELDHLQVMLV